MAGGRAGLAGWGRDAVRLQIVGDSLGAKLRKLLVRRLCADRVRMPLDTELHGRTALGDVGDAGQERGALLVEIGTAGLEIDGTGLRDDVEARLALRRRDAVALDK